MPALPALPALPASPAPRQRHPPSKVSRGTSGIGIICLELDVAGSPDQHGKPLHKQVWKKVFTWKVYLILDHVMMFWTLPILDSMLDFNSWYSTVQLHSVFEEIGSLKMVAADLCWPRPCRLGAT